MASYGPKNPVTVWQGENRGDPEPLGEDKGVFIEYGAGGRNISTEPMDAPGVSEGISQTAAAGVTGSISGAEHVTKNS